MKEPIPEELIAKINAALERDKRINTHQWQIKVWTENGRLVLDGTVENIAAKRMALTHAKKITDGQWPVVDMLMVSSSAPKEDLELRDSLAEALIRESSFSRFSLYTEVGGKVELLQDPDNDMGRIHATVSRGVVRLTGRVFSLSHRRLAEVLTWWCDGVSRVDNFLEVIPEQDDNDNELTDIVRMVLEKNPLVHADQLRVGTSAGVVRLDGSVASKEEKRLANLDAWYVPDVWDVDDHIEVHS